MTKRSKGSTEVAPLEEFLPIARRLRDARNRRDWTLLEASRKIGISVSFLSEVEKALKVPSALVIRDIADVYDLDETELATAYKRTPISVAEELAEASDILRMIYDIKNAQTLSEDEKDDFYRRVLDLYRDAVKGDE